MEAPLYRQLWPAGPNVDARNYVRSLDLRRRQLDRPYVLANFVASVDGHATVDGRSRKLSDHADRELFYALRERADAVLVGPNTLAAERYKRMLPDPGRRERRTVAGRPAEPLAVTVTRTGKLPRDIPLFTETPDNVLVFEQTELPDALRTLRHDHGVKTLLCEGGPTLFGALLQERLVDELYLTLAPRLVGGEASGPAVISAPTHPPPEAPASLQLANVLERNSTLFLRYRFP